jgi:hypothetical protein
MIQTRGSHQVIRRLSEQFNEYGQSNIVHIVVSMTGVESLDLHKKNWNEQGSHQVIC